MPSQKPRGKRLAYGLPHSTEAILATASEVQRMMASGLNPDGSLKPQAIRALLKVGASKKCVPESVLHWLGEPQRSILPAARGCVEQQFPFFLIGPARHEIDHTTQSG